MVSKLAGVTAVLLALLALLGAGDASAATLTVCSRGGADHSTIQAAVDAASPGDTIVVCPGDYHEQVVITKNGLTLVSEEPRAAAIRAFLGMHNGPAPQGRTIVTVDGARDVTIRGFTIAGPGFPHGGSNTITNGVLIVGDGSATLENNHITDIRDDPLLGTQNGHAIRAGGIAGELHASGTLTAIGNTIDGYQKTGIVVNAEGSHAVIAGNSIIGAGPAPPGPAQNGIQVSRGATASIHDNFFADNSFTGAAAATGVLVLESGAVDIARNRFDDNEVQIQIQDSAGAPVTIEGNAISGGSIGIRLLRTTGATVSNNTVVGAVDGGLVANDSTGNTWQSNSTDTACIDTSSGGGTGGTGNDWAGDAGIDDPSHNGICSAKPITTIALNPPAPDGQNGEWSEKGVRVTVAAHTISGGPAVTETRCVLDPDTPPTRFDQLPAGPCPYLEPHGGLVTRPGAHTVYAMSRDAGGGVDNAMRSLSFKISGEPEPEPPPTGPDLRLTKIGSTDTVHPGDQVSYHLVVSNRGQRDARHVTVVDVAPRGLTFRDARASQGGRCTVRPREIRCTLETLPGGGSALVLVTATVDADAAGTLVNRAGVWDDRNEFNEANNSASRALRVTARPAGQPVSDLVVTKRVDRRVATRGQRLRYTITVTNRGPDTATALALTDTTRLPVRVVSVRAGPWQCRTGPPLSCTLGTLRAGARVTVRITAVTTVVGTQVNTAALMSRSRDPSSRNSIARAVTRIVRAAPPFTG